MKFVIILTLLLTLCFGDAITTIHGLNQGLVEANPLLRKSNFEIWLVMKLGISFLTFIIPLACYNQARKEKALNIMKLVQGIIYGLTIFYMFILTNNIIQLFRLTL